MRTRPSRILIAAGGTGGHVYPAIAVAEAIRELEPEAAVAFAGTRDRMEWQTVPRAGYPIHPITAAAFNRSQKLKNLKLPGQLGKGLMQSLQLVEQFDADAVLGAGGFVAGPVGMAAWIKGRALVLQEQNAFAGVTNRLLGKVADEVHIAFPEAAKAFPEAKTELSGNPVRANLRNVSRGDARTRLGLEPDVPLLLVFGGSLGSQALNEALMAGVARFRERTDAHILWQTGERYYQRVVETVAPDAGVTIRRYLDDMAAAYAAADVALCRAGASTCSELLATGTPAILVPSPNVAEDHQTHNARSLVSVGAAELLPEPQLLNEWADRAVNLLEAPGRRNAMARAAAANAVYDAAPRIAQSVLNLARQRVAA